MSRHVHGRQMPGGDSQATPMDLFGAPQRETRPFVDWRNAVRIVRRRVWPAATVAVIVFVAAVVHAFTQVPVYEAKARILIEADRANPAGLKDPLEEDRSTVTDYQTQLMILQSRSLARQTMQALGVWDRPIAMKPEVERGSLRAFGAAASHGARSVMSWLWEPAAAVPTASARRDDGENGDDTTKIDGFLAGLRVSPVPDTRLVDVYYTSPDAPVSAMYVNAIVTHFIQQNAEAKMTASKEVIEWLNARLVEQRKTLETSEASLHRYRSRHNIVSIDEQASVSVQKLTEMTAAVTKAKTDRIEKEAMFKQLESVKGDRAALESFPAVLANPFVQQLRSELIALQRQQAQVAEKFGARHPNRIKINDQVTNADSRLQAEIAKVLASVRNEFAGARAAEEALDQTLEVQKRDTAVPERQRRRVRAAAARCGKQSSDLAEPAAARERVRRDARASHQQRPHRRRRRGAEAGAGRERAQEPALWCARGVFSRALHRVLPRVLRQPREDARADQDRAGAAVPRPGAAGECTGGRRLPPRPGGRRRPSARASRPGLARPSGSFEPTCACQSRTNGRSRCSSPARAWARARRSWPATSRRRSRCPTSGCC